MFGKITVHINSLAAVIILFYRQRYYLASSDHILNKRNAVNMLENNKTGHSLTM